MVIRFCVEIDDVDGQMLVWPMYIKQMKRNSIIGTHSIYSKCVIDSVG